MARRARGLRLIPLVTLLALVSALGTARADSHAGTMGDEGMGDNALGGKAKVIPLAQQDANGLAGSLVWVAHEAQADEPVTHSHERGFVYAVDGMHTFTVGGETFTLQEGQAGWVGEDARHTHSGGTFWDIRLAAPGTGAPQGLEGAEQVFESETLQGIPSGQAQLRFVLVELPPQSQTSVHSHPGPEYIYVSRGDIVYQNAIIGTRTMEVGDDEALPPNTAVQKRNPDDEMAAFLSWFVVDPSKPFAPEATFDEMPDEMPDTGAGGMAGGMPLGGMAAALSLLLAAGYAAIRRR